jgi:hypothetical protein
MYAIGVVVGAVVFSAVALVQLAAFQDGAGLWLGIGWLLSSLLFFALYGLIPFGEIGVILLTFYGAWKAWRWPWFGAAVLAAPGLVPMALFGFGGAAGAVISRLRGLWEYNSASTAVQAPAAATPAPLTAAAPLAPAPRPSPRSTSSRTTETTGRLLMAALSEIQSQWADDYFKKRESKLALLNTMLSRPKEERLRTVSYDELVTIVGSYDREVIERLTKLIENELVLLALATTAIHHRHMSAMREGADARDIRVVAEEILRRLNAAAPRGMFCFNDPEAFFRLQCKYGHVDIQVGTGQIAIVLDAAKMFGVPVPVKIKPDGSQEALLKVVSEDGGFVVMAKTLGKGDRLVPGDIVMWVPVSYSNIVASVGEDKRFGWVGLIRAKVDWQWSDPQKNFSDFICRYKSG